MTLGVDADAIETKFQILTAPQMSTLGHFRRFANDAVRPNRVIGFPPKRTFNVGGGWATGWAVL